MKGANDEDIQKEREILLMFLKGTKNAKEKAKNVVVHPLQVI